MKHVLVLFLSLLSFHVQAEGFHGDTLALTPTGHRPISSLSVGDEVISFEEGCGKEVTLESKKIVGITSFLTGETVTIYAGGETLTVDGDTKIFSLSDRRWVKASEVLTGSLLLTSILGSITVDAVHVDKSLTLNYVVEVEDHHTLFVSGSNILVHNGPVAAAVCGVVCKIVATVGCGAGALIIGVANPGIGIVYAAVCSALDAGATASCVTVCLALPTP